MTIIKTFEAEEKNKFPKLILPVIFGLTILTLMQIWVSNTVVAFGEKYEKLFDLEKNLKMENQILEMEIAKASSLNTIASKSAELGLTQSPNIQYIR